MCLVPFATTVAQDQCEDWPHNKVGSYPARYKVTYCFAVSTAYSVAPDQTAQLRRRFVRRI
ncbi:hypothetical protein DPMN_074421 [Dreissena polymorpha]|uniref:Uncharacterized protein n=1 Tax=Dreissena polymorpha TaxID=45954 RepID=A0A9D4BE16_DREPO|nr:hypothetical protein DPMN_074421 [Dreissena polymorpha]